MTKVSKMIDHWTGSQLEDREAESLQAKTVTDMSGNI